MLTLLSKVNVFLNQGMAWIAGISLLAMVFVVVTNVISRVIYVPFVGTTEVVGWLAALTTGFGLGYTQVHKGYVDIDALVEQFPPPLRFILRAGVLLISTIFFFMVTWKVSAYALLAKHNGNLSETMGIVFYPLIFLLSVGFAGLTLALAVDFLMHIIRRAK